MICKRISVEGFRNIECATVEFCDGVNILVGNNAQGKTNLLEAIYFITLGKSFRSATESEMIGFSSDHAAVSLDFCDSVREQNISVRIFRDHKKRFEQNGVKIFKMSDIVGEMRAVLFCPEHLSIIKDGPSLRRNFLDVAISQLRPMYLRSLQKYNKYLKQRNKLLKDAENDRKTFDDTIEFWSAGLATEGAYLAKMRKQYVETCDGYVKKYFAEMTGGDELPKMVYSGSAKQELEAYDDEKATEARYFELLSSNLEREIAVGSTLWGAHKDDIDISINGREARVYCSQGQQRSLALAMKLAEGEICRKEGGEYPVFLFDDVLSELDPRRRAYLINEIKDKQVIMTGCEIGILTDPDMIKDLSVNVIRVEGGKYYKD